MHNTNDCQNYRLFQKRRNTRIAFVKTLYVHWQTDVVLHRSFDDVRLSFEEGLLWDQTFLDLLFDFYEQNHQMLTEKLTQSLRYDISRFTLIDRALLLAAITEMSSCPFTDKSVIINEFLEITKEYSEPSSFKTINAILDKIDFTEVKNTAQEATPA